MSFCDHWMSIGVATVLPAKSDTGMRKFRLDQDFLIEHWHMIYLMTVVFAVQNLFLNEVKLNFRYKLSIN